MVGAGTSDVLIAFNIIGQIKLECLARLVRLANIAVIGDSE